MTPDDLVRKHPRLWHMAEDGCWPSIAEHGLLSTSALLDLYGISGERRVAIERRHRPESVAIARPGFAGAVVRDQKPMSQAALLRCLDGMAPEDWYVALNARVFFWPTLRRLTGLLGAGAYRGNVQTVLTLDTRSIVDAYAATIELSPINSGSTIMRPARRGALTFSRIADFPGEPSRRQAGRPCAVAEVVVPDRVAPVVDHVLAVHRVHAGAILEELWRSPRAEPGDVAPDRFQSPSRP
ncbi:hypothetical protein [Methylobacterium sp. B1]|uniref:DUF7002 family protein n=1 Tax=Methylobacterium sp. B1 TaxID=91459 RepID=UPI00034A7062|nr:hypothetical protein [Methylobacterium sp. B1]